MSEVVKNLLTYNGEAPADPPLLLLGQFERVGSTFYCDQLEKNTIVHNEPYKLLVPAHWPISRAYRGALVSVDEFLESADTPSVDKHWLRNFTTSLHHPGNQVVKETNLYLALPNFLDLLPHSDIELLTRNPLGIISSFKRSDLYRRWAYADVGETLKEQLVATKPKNHEALGYMLEQGAGWQDKLAWMIGLNAVLLSRHIDAARMKKIVSYEEDIIPLGSEDTASDQDVNTRDSIFDTNIYKDSDDFEARFTQLELTSVLENMGQCVEFVEAEFDDADTSLFLPLYKRYTQGEYVSKISRRTARTIGRVSKATEEHPQFPAVPQYENSPRKLVKLHEDMQLLWDYSLVTNAQMGEFLQELNKYFSGSLNHLLLLDNMPPSRGGRITYDRRNDQFLSTEGFENHPAYWVTWLTASLYAYKTGMRLPTYDEWERVYKEGYEAPDHPNANHTYMNDDTVSTGTGTSIMPDDFFGNLRIWCSDWSNQRFTSKKLAGISWKNYMHDGYSTKSERPYLAGSRVIGVRLVCCGECKTPQERTLEETADKLRDITALIDGERVVTGEDLAHLNKKVSQIINSEPCVHPSEG